MVQGIPPAPSGGPRGVEIDAAQVTYYESGVLASATRIRRSEWAYDHGPTASRGDWAGGLARWLVAFWWTGLGVATTAGGVWGACVLFGWPGLIASLLVLTGILTSASSTP
jgi:hypothetical protein